MFLSVSKVTFSFLLIYLNYNIKSHNLIANAGANAIKIGIC